MKAILTRFSGPTDTRGARILVQAEGCKRRSVAFDFAAKDAHVSAALDYATALGWLGTYAVATLPDGSKAHVPVLSGAGGNTYESAI